MELHESLHELGSRLGHGLFTDAENFRGALDDYVDESSATVGDINLLVDAVRLGAFRSMTTMLESGASADSAIAEAGTRLARDRGSSDAHGAQWACAVLGYAIDQVTEQQVRHYTAQRGGMSVGPPPGSSAQPPPYQSPQQSPHQSPQQPPPYRSPQPPPYQSPQAPRPDSGQRAPAQSPPAAPVQPTIWPSSGSVGRESSVDRTATPGQGASSVDRGTNPRMAAGGTPPATARPGSQPAAGPGPTQFQSGGVQSGGVQSGGVQSGGVQSGGVQSGGTPGGPRTPSVPTPAAATPSPSYSTAPRGKKSPLPIIAAAAAVILVIGVGIVAAITLRGDDGGDGDGKLALSDVNADYKALADDVTAGADDCTSGDRSLGQQEVVTCVVEGGTLTLITYNDAEALQDARAKTVNLAKGTLADEGAEGTFFSYDPTGVEDSEVGATVYWDNEKAAQAATYTATGDDQEGKAEDLTKLYKDTKPTVSEPDDIDSSDLDSFADDFNLADCSRVYTRYNGATEESKCDLEGNDVYAGQFSSVRFLNALRKWARKGSAADGCPNQYRGQKNPNCVNSVYYTDIDGVPGYSPSGGDIQRGRVWGFIDENDDDNGVMYIERADCLCYLLAYDGGKGKPKDLSDVLSKQLGD